MHKLTEVYTEQRMNIRAAAVTQHADRKAVCLKFSGQAAIKCFFDEWLSFFLLCNNDIKHHFWKLQ